MSFALQSSWNVHNSWDELKAEFNKDYMSKLDEFLRSELAHGFYPSAQDIFKAFDATPLDAVRVVILGQDPYFQESQATGLAFAVPSGTKLPGSLTNLFRELAANGCRRPPNSDLTWATQGVLLLNCILTVHAGGPPNSHRWKGWWTRFTNRAIELVNSKDSGVVFCLWGRNAQRKDRLITGTHHLVLKASHPSPRWAHRALTDSSRFLGCQHFLKANRRLEAQGDNPIRW